LFRSVKIKAFIVFLAWGVVFLHGVIPHIHLNEQYGSCSSLLHESDFSEQGSIDSDHIKGGHNDHEKVCHFSTIMYQQQGFADMLANSSQKPRIIPSVIILSVIIYDQDNILPIAKTGPSHLRAPPVA
jgi:hypothetical protein